MADDDEVSGRKRINCSPCSRDGQYITAANFCIQCDAYFCKDCTKHHGRLLFNHPIKDVLSEDVQVAIGSPTETCREHGRKVDYYCKQHDKLGCSTCMTLDHRTCDPVMYIPKSAEELFQSTDIKDLKSKITETLKRLEAIKVQKFITKSDLDKQRVKFLDKIEVVQKYDKMNAELKRHNQEVETSLVDLKAAEERLDVSNGNSAQQFIEYKKCQNIILATDQVSKDADTNVRRIWAYNVLYTVWYSKNCPYTMR